MTEVNSGPELPESKLHKLTRLSREGALKVRARGIEVLQDVKDKTPGNLRTARETIDGAREKVQEVAQTGREVATKMAEQAPAVADKFLTQSRESRLTTEAEEAKHLNPVQKLFRTKILGWMANTLVQSIPSPVGYGVGDVVTLAGAVLGHDLMTGRKLDILGRVIYGAAALVPGVPATVLMLPLQVVRYGIEEAHHAAKHGRQEDVIKHLQNTFKEIGTVRGVVSGQLSNRRMVKSDGDGDGEV